MEGELSLLPRVTQRVNSRAHSRISESIQILGKTLSYREKLWAHWFALRKRNNGRLLNLGM